MGLKCKTEIKFTKTDIGIIPEDWTVRRLQDITLLITDGKHGDCENQKNSGYYFLSVKDITKDGKLNYSEAREITEDDFIDTQRRTQLETGDVLLSNSGTIGRLAIAKDNEKTKHTTFQKSVAIIKPNKSLLDSSFLYYYLLANTKRIIDAAGGTTQKNLLLKDLRSFKIAVPTLNIQKAVISPLLIFDSKIELLQKMNTTLEEICEEIFKHWFVYFEFPNNGGYPYNSSGGKMIYNETSTQKIPNEFKIGKLADLGKIVTGKTPPTVNAEYYDGNHMFLKIPDMTQTYPLKTFTTLSDSGLEKVKNFMLPENSLSISCIGTLGLVTINKMPLVTNQNINSIIFNDTSFLYYVYFNAKKYGALLENLGGGGSVFGTVSKSKFEEIKILIPPKNLLDKFNNVINPLFEKIYQNALEIEILYKIRNFLLPKLMSGKIRVPVEAN